MRGSGSVMHAAKFIPWNILPWTVVAPTMTANMETFEALVRAETRLWNQLDRVLVDQQQLPLGWLVALRVVQASPGGRVQDLAAHLDISAGGASKLVDRLVSAGLVDRAADASDRRASRLSLTASGALAARRGSESAEAWLAARFERLGRQEASQLSTLVADLSRQVAAEGRVA